MEKIYKYFLKRRKRRLQAVVLVPFSYFQVSPLFLMHYWLVLHFFTLWLFHCVFSTARLSLLRFILLSHANSFPVYSLDAYFSYAATSSSLGEERQTWIQGIRREEIRCQAWVVQSSSGQRHNLQHSELRMPLSACNGKCGHPWH